VTYHIERATFPQWDGINRTANIAIATENEFNQISAPVQDPSLGTVIPHLNFQASNVGLIMADRVCQSTEVRFSGSVAMLRRDIVPTTTVQSSKGNPLTTTDWQRA
jgi:hypothetical protein